MEAENIVKPGIIAETVDQKARKIIEEERYGDYFINRTGHGIGISVHEGPYIKTGNKLKLKEGMAFSIEPGIYLPNRLQRLPAFGNSKKENCAIKVFLNHAA